MHLSRMDRHADTKLEIAVVKKPKSAKQNWALVDRSASAPVTSMDRHTSTDVHYWHRSSMKQNPETSKKKSWGKMDLR